jgi:hypothetical protein
MNNNSMTLDQAKSKVLDMDNKTLENFVNQRIGNDSELANFARNELADRNNLNAWQNGSLINTDAINNLSLGDLKRVAQNFRGCKMNEYKVVFYNHNISDGYIQVIRGILAKSDNHAIEKIMNTWNIYKNWIISTSVIKLNRSSK